MAHLKLRRLRTAAGIPEGSSALLSRQSTGLQQSYIINHCDKTLSLGWSGPELAVQDQIRRGKLGRVRRPGGLRSDNSPTM